MSADGRAVNGATVSLLRAGSAPGAADLLATTTTDAAGGFALRVPGSVNDGHVLYVTARGGRTRQRQLPSTVELATSLADLRSGRSS